MTSRDSRLKSVAEALDKYGSLLDPFGGIEDERSKSSRLNGLLRVPITVQALARKHVADAGKPRLIRMLLPQRFDDLRAAHHMGEMGLGEYIKEVHGFVGARSPAATAPRHEDSFILEPFLEAYADLNYQPADFPVAHAQMSKILSLPMYAELTEEMIEKVCRSLKNAIAMSAAN